METTDALAELAKVAYKGWDLRYRADTLTPDGMIEVAVEYRVDNSSPREDDPRDWVIASSGFELPANEASGPYELHRMMLDRLHGITELHESAEFYRVDGWAPFRPHRVDGHERYSRTARVATPPKLI